MVGTKAYRSTFVSGSKLYSLEGDPLANVSEYWQLVGALHYCTLTHPKIAYTINQLY